MKKTLLAAIAAFGLLFVSCTTMTPILGVNSYPTGKDYKILGRVTTSTGISASGYMKLLEEAKKQYPECDDVINIMVDRKMTKFLIFKSYTYTMSAIAVDYTDM